jgi:hypothetical protein
MYEIYMLFEGRQVPMPSDHGLSLIEATRRADLYKKRNPARTFTVCNEINGDIEYQT